jgi:type IV pilus assembly protein PilP
MNKRLLNIDIRILCIMSMLVTLTGCGTGKGDDLDQFMADAANDMRVKIPPLPEVKPYIPIQYNEDGTLNDPFKARKATAKEGALQPNLNRPREPLEAYPLEALKYVGSMTKQKLQYALIKTPDNNVQQVKIGNYIGQNFGIVATITENEVALKEIIQDEITGDWTERSNTLSLQE